MSTAYDYLVWGIAAAIIAVGLLAVALMRRSSRTDLAGPDQLQTLGVTLVILGILFGDDRLVGYSFLSVGVLLSIASIVVRRRRGKM